MAATAQAVEENVDQQQAQSASDDKTQVQSVEFSQASEGKTAGQGASIDILLGMEVPVTVIIGKVEIQIQKFLQLTPGSVLKLDKSIDSPVELYIKDTKFAVGNIVVVDDKFAVRIKEVLGVAAPALANKK